MLKGIGVFMVLSGCIGLGGYAVSHYAARIRTLAELEQALHFLYGEIEYSGCDLIELLDKLAGRGGSLQMLWQNMADCLRSYDGQGFFSHWKREIRKISSNGMLRRDDLELLDSIGENLGNTDRQTQLHTLECFQEQLHHILLQARQEYREKAKISMILGMTAGLFLVLLLI